MPEPRDLAKALEALSSGRADAADASSASDRPAMPLDLQSGAPVIAPTPIELPGEASEWPATLWPISATLALTLPALGTAWFLLDPTRVIRSIPVYVPLAMIAAGLACAVASVVLWRGLTRSARST